MMQPERIVTSAREAPKGSRHRLPVSVDSETSWATLDMGLLAHADTAAPDRVRDLLEIATWIYAADALVSCGAASDAMLGRNWRRRFLFRLQVRDPDFWTTQAGRLTKVIALIPEDLCRFEFEQGRALLPEQDPLPGHVETFRPDCALLFSGGLDSLAGALEEVVARNSRVVLVSNRSATTASSTSPSD